MDGVNRKMTRRDRAIEGEYPNAANPAIGSLKTEDTRRRTTKRHKKMLEHDAQTFAGKYPPRIFRHTAASASPDPKKKKKSWQRGCLQSCVAGGWRDRLRNGADKNNPMYLQYEAVKTAVGKQTKKVPTDGLHAIIHV